MELFKLEGELPVLHPEARTIESLRKIIARDKRDKSLAIKELAYCYFMASNKHFTNYTFKQKESTVRKRVSLPENWEADDLIVEAIKDLTEDSLTPSQKLLETAKQSIYTTMDLLALLQKGLEDRVKQLSEAKAVNIADIEVTRESMLATFELQNKIPKIIEEYHRIEKLSYEDVKSMRKGYSESLLEDKLRSR